MAVLKETPQFAVYSEVKERSSPMDLFETYRPMLFSIAYRMLRSAMEAEDMVQETYLRYQAAPPESIRSLKNFLGTVITRLCLDQLKSARVQRETYIGPWLPEPVLTGPSQPYFSSMREDDSISTAFLLLLENLNPIERAVFLLREVFDYEYSEIAEIVGKEEAACRQLFSRAKKHITENRPRFRSSPETHRKMLARFMRAVATGELDGLMNLLAEDISWWTDGGGKVKAATRPVHGREHVARFVLGLTRFLPAGFRIEVIELNGRPGIILRNADRTPFYAITFEIEDSCIHRVWAIINPDKLKHL